MLEWIGPGLRALPFGHKLYARLRKRGARPKRRRAAELLEDHPREGQRLLSAEHGLSEDDWFEAVCDWHARSIALLIEHRLPHNQLVIYDSTARDHGEELTTDQDARKVQLTSARTAHGARVTKFRLVVSRYIQDSGFKGW